MRRSSAHLRVEVADANELVLSLGAATGRVATSGVSSTATDARAVALADQVRRFAPSSWMWTHLVSVVAESPRPRDVDAFLMYLDRMPALEVQRRLVGYYTSWFRDLTPPDVMDRALHGDAAARLAFLRSAMPEDAAWHESLRSRLDAGAEATKRELLDVIDAWHDDVFRALARATMRELRRAVRATRSESVDATVRAFIGHVPSTDPRTEEVVIVPSLVLDDEIHEFDHTRTLFLCVPLERASRGTPSELGTLVRVLADDSRTAILSALSREDLTAQQIADRVRLGLSTTLHHLAMLRRAGFVTHGGRRRAYVLRPAPLKRLRALLGELDGDG